MSSRFRFPEIAVFKLAAVVGVLLLAGTISCVAQPLLVCADPQNAPFSDCQKTGFDNRIAEVIGADLHRPVRFYWARKGRGFVREVVNKGSCDVLIDIPLGAHGLLISQPLYRSTYVFVTRRSFPAVTSLDDPNLRRMKIGVQILGDGYAPPAQALAAAGSQQQHCRLRHGQRHRQHRLGREAGQSGRGHRVGTHSRLLY